MNSTFTFTPTAILCAGARRRLYWAFVVSCACDGRLVPSWLILTGKWLSHGMLASPHGTVCKCVSEMKVTVVTYGRNPSVLRVTDGGAGGSQISSIRALWPPHPPCALSKVPLSLLSVSASLDYFKIIFGAQSQNCQKRLSASSCLSVRPPCQTRPPLERL